jgi:mannose-6-phosphate isomerase-like protein (cupin superfamily)
MIVQNQLLDTTPKGMKFTILKTSEETNGQSLDMEWEILPDYYMKDPLKHSHSQQIVTYEILEGELEFLVDGKYIKVNKGECITIDKGTTYSFRNSSGLITRVYNTYKPAMVMENKYKNLNHFSDNNA